MYSSLAGFHSSRSVLYRAIAYLIGAPANERTRGIVRAILDECPHRSSARDELEQALVASMSLADSASIADACERRYQEVRTHAFDAAGLAVEDTPGSEAEVMSSLADRSAHALRVNDLGEAAKLAELQYRFIEEHAAGCLLALAARLKSRTSEYLFHLGRAIELLVCSDLDLLKIG